MPNVVGRTSSAAMRRPYSSSTFTTDAPGSSNSLRFAAIHHPPEGVLEVDGLGRRALHLLLHSSHHALHRAEEPRSATGCLEQVADQEGGRGLAVGPGYANHVELGRRVSVEACGGGPHRGADVVHDHVRHAELQRALRDQRRGAAVHRVWSEIVAVRAKAGDAKKERPRSDALAGIGEVRDLDLGRLAAHQVAKGHAPGQDNAVTPQTFVQAADTHCVSGTVLSALARLAERRFTSFSEAADTVLDLLETELPPGSILLGRVDWDEGELRLIDVRGAATSELGAGSTLPLASTSNGSRNGLLDPRALQRLAVRSYIALPLDSSSGAGALTLCALAPGTDVFNQEHLEVLSIAGRLLTYEWESVKWRADLRRLNERLRDPERTDALTGLLNRIAFVEAAEREWRLAERGTLETYVLACRITNVRQISERHGVAVGELLLKDAADVMQTAIRRTDHAGRLADDAFGAVLVGCKGLDGAAAFIGRYGQALQRVTHERPAQLEVAYAMCSLGDAESPEAALERIETEARNSTMPVPGEVA